MATVPVPFKTSSRTCFGIAYFTTEATASEYARHIEKSGDTYNGGYMHGVACGRDTSWDYTDTSGRKLYAVTTS